MKTFYKVSVGFGLILMIHGLNSFSQVAMNKDNSSPDSSAMLDVKSTTSGMLIPRMTRAQRTAIVRPANALLVYQTDNDNGFYYNAGSKSDTNWIYMGGWWSLKGNPGIDPGGNPLNNFFGTLDAEDLVFKTNNAERLRIKNDFGSVLPNPDDAVDLGSADYAFRNLFLSGNVRFDDTVFLDNPGIKSTFIGITGNSTNTGYNNTFLGYYAGKANTSGYDNLFAGVQAGTANTTGFCNSASGFQSLHSNTSGWNNSAHGYGTLYTNSTGMDNSAMGVGALYSNTSGNKNSALGYSALYSNVTGDSNVAIGYLSNVSTGNLSDVVVIGSGAIATANDQVRLGNSHAKSLYCMGAFTPTTSESPNMYVSNTGQIMRSTATGSGGEEGGVGGTGVPAEIAFWKMNDTITSDSNLYWDNVNKRLGIGTKAPSQQIDFTKNMNMPMSTATAGNIYKDGQLFIHNYYTYMHNTFMGLEAGNITLWGDATDNTGIGFRALKTLTTGLGNTAIGSNALYSNMEGIWNTACGYNALMYNVSGSDNCAYGSGTLQQNTSGTQNTAYGAAALKNNTTTYYNVAIGCGALHDLTSGGLGPDRYVSNVAVGTFSLYHTNPTNTDNGRYNVGVGHESMYENTSGYMNSALGYHSLFSNTNGFSNVAIGCYSLFSNDSGYYNVAVGNNSLFSNTVGTANVAVGLPALDHNIDGNLNVGIGSYALHLNTTGDNNVAIGYAPLFNNITGNLNVAIGFETMASNSEANNCIAIGYQALHWQSQSVGDNDVNNTAIGYQALLNTCPLSAYDGRYNVGVGHQVLLNNSTGYENTAIGYLALSANFTGHLNTAVGYNANVFFNNLFNATAIGANASVNASNKVRIGNNQVTVIEGQVPFTHPSDIRIKKNISEINAGLDFILRLHPVEYQTLTETRLNYGFIAQEIEELVGTQNAIVTVNNDDERTLGLRYTDFIAPIVKAIQEQQTMIEELKKQNEELKHSLEKLEKNDRKKTMK